MTGKAEFIYSGFYDAPLTLVVWHSGQQFLFLRRFDDTLDDYPDKYRVFTLPGFTMR